MSKSGKKSIDLPGALVELFENEEGAGTEIAKAAVVDLVIRGKIPPHHGAEILRVRDEDFVALIMSQEVPIIDYQ